MSGLSFLRSLLSEASKAVVRHWIAVSLVALSGPIAIIWAYAKDTLVPLWITVVTGLSCLVLGFLIPALTRVLDNRRGSKKDGAHRVFIEPPPPDAPLLVATTYGKPYSPRSMGSCGDRMFPGILLPLESPTAH